MRLANFILDEMQSILQAWEAFAGTLEPAAGNMTRTELRNHARAMLAAIAEDLVTTQSVGQEIAKSQGLGPRTEQTLAGEEHGLARMTSNFSTEQLVAEFRALRSSVLRLWKETNSVPSLTDVEDMIRFNEAIDQLLAASVCSFAHAAREAMEADRQRKDQFLAMLAHELRNPLAPISAAATLLKVAKNDSAAIDNASNIIARQVAHMAALLDDLLDVSRITRGAVALRVDPLDLRQVIEDAVEQVAPQMKAKQHILTVVQAPGPVTMQADKKRLVQIVTNLLTNAAKYTANHGRIVLKTEVSGDQIAIAVEDNGIGMTADFVPHAFDVFAQAQRTPDRSSGGLGLGLALVKSLAQLHRGTVACSSEGLGKGSQFTVCFPRPAALVESDLERRRTPRLRLSAENTLRIMVVDDNVDAAQSLSLLLIAAGHQVFTEYGAHRALDVARREVPDVCVLDIGLPEMDGNELARRLRADPVTAGKMLIALTGYCQIHDREESIRAGFDHFMTKPIDIARLQTVLATVPQA